MSPSNRSACGPGLAAALALVLAVLPEDGLAQWAT
jgi:hypothetical protein